MSIIGLDVGTTGCKAIVFNESGQILGQAAREYGIATPHAGWAEQDAEAVWTLAWESLKEAAGAARSDPPLALALSVQGEAVIPVDEHGRACGRPFWVWIPAPESKTSGWPSSSAQRHCSIGPVCRCIQSIPCPSCSGYNGMSPRCGGRPPNFCCTKTFSSAAWAGRRLSVTAWPPGLDVRPGSRRLGRRHSGPVRY